MKESILKRSNTEKLGTSSLNALHTIELLQTMKMGCSIS